MGYHRTFSAADKRLWELEKEL